LEIPWILLLSRFSMLCVDFPAGVLRDFPLPGIFQKEFLGFSKRNSSTFFLWRNPEVSIRNSADYPKGISLWNFLGFSWWKFQRKIRKC
jgi:hypothetical protein